MNLDCESDLPIERMLGLSWNPNTDGFMFSPRNKVSQGKNNDLLTTHQVLSKVMAVFDPLSFLLCFAVTVKTLLQEVGNLELIGMISYHWNFSSIEKHGGKNFNG